METKAATTAPRAMKIAKCNCEHKSQDELHGKGMRAFNPCKAKTGDGKAYRCTVCGKET